MYLFSTASGSFLLPLGNVVIALGVFFAAWLLTRTVRDEEVSIKFLSDHLGILVVIPLVFGRIGAVIAQWPLLQQTLDPGLWNLVLGTARNFFLIGTGGLELDWAFMGLILTFILLASWRGEKGLVWLDTFTLPAIVVLMSFSLGAHFNGWGYGSPSPTWLSWPFSVTYELINVRYHGAIYAVQLYGAFLFGLLGLLGWGLWRRRVYRRWPPGRFAGVMLILAALLNAFLSLFRGEEGIALLGVFTVSQFFGLLLISVLGIYLLSRNRKWIG